MTKQPSHLFVYGTLMSGFGLHDKVASLTKVADGTVEGNMLSINGWYPGLVPGVGRVHGELYALPSESSKRDALINAIDWVEGYSPNRDAFSNHYNRKVVVVTTPDGAVSAWVYFYNNTVDRLDVVESGNWREHEERSRQPLHR